MPDGARDPSPLHWPVATLVAAYRRGELSPVEVAREALDRIERLDPELNAFVVRLDALALEQAGAAERAYRDGAAGPLAGVPVSVKDTFPLAGAVTTFGSLVHRDHRSAEDSGVVRRLRAAGAVFTGKTNTAEFGQSATTDNRLGGPARNPWDVARTPGGSSGGAVASVAAGLSTVAVGADGGGSIRIPAAFTGLFGLKPTIGAVDDEGGLRAMVDFCCPGPFAWRVADARVVLDVLTGSSHPRRRPPAGLRIGWCPRPEGRPVDPGVAAAAGRSVARLGALGHHVEDVDLPVAGWQEIFGPLVLHDEARERGHLLDGAADRLTDYERRSIEQGLALAPGVVETARRRLVDFRNAVRSFFDGYDLVVTPATAVPAFPHGERPRVVSGEAVDWLWGAVPFAAPFNVSGNPAASLPCGLAGALPAGLQIVGRHGAEGLVLDVAEALEEVLDVDRSAVRDRWRDTRAPARAAR